MDTTMVTPLSPDPNTTCVNASLCSPILSNHSTDALLEMYLGARYRTLAESVVLSIVYCLIFITGVVGNVCTCIVIIRNGYMHTATNYYLFSMAVADVLTLILGKSLTNFINNMTVEIRA